jgi:hypothetical protein
MEAEAMTGTTEKTALDLLREGRDLIAAGWMREGYADLIDGVPCYCAMGALGDLTPLDADTMPLSITSHAKHVAATYGVLHREDAAFFLARGFADANGYTEPNTHGRYSSAAHYIIDANDDPYASQTLVLAAFDAAIARAALDARGAVQA